MRATPHRGYVWKRTKEVEGHTTMRAQITPVPCGHCAFPISPLLGIQCVVLCVDGTQDCLGLLHCLTAAAVEASAFLITLAAWALPFLQPGSHSSHPLSLILCAVFSPHHERCLENELYELILEYTAVPLLRGICLRVFLNRV